MAGQPVSGKLPSNGNGPSQQIAAVPQLIAALSKNPQSKSPPLPLPKTEGPMTNPLPKAKSVKLVTLLNSHSIDAEYPDGSTITFDATSGFRKLVPGQTPARPLPAEIKRFQQDVAEATKGDYAIDAFMRANPKLTLDYDKIWDQAITRTPYSNSTTFAASMGGGGGTLRPYPHTPYRGRVALNRAEPPVQPTQPNAEQRPGPVKIIQLASSFAVEKDYGAYVIGYTHNGGFTKYNKTMACSVRANDAEIRVFQKDVKAAVESKDAAVEAFVKDNPGVLKS